MKSIFICLLKEYKKIISPIIEALGIHCKFYPSCSEYMMQAIEKYGCIKGMYLGIKRLLKFPLEGTLNIFQNGQSMYYLKDIV